VEPHGTTNGTTNGRTNGNTNGTDTATIEAEREALRAALNFPNRDVNPDDSFGGVAPRVSPTRFWPLGRTQTAPATATEPGHDPDLEALQAKVDRLADDVQALDAKLYAILEGLFGTDNVGRRSQ